MRLATLTTICADVTGHADSPGWGKQEGFTFSPTAIQAAILFSEEIFSGSKASYLCATSEVAAGGFLYQRRRYWQVPRLADVAGAASWRAIMLTTGAKKPSHT